MIINLNGLSKDCLDVRDLTIQEAWKDIENWKECKHINIHMALCKKILKQKLVKSEVKMRHKLVESGAKIRLFESVRGTVGA